MLIVEEDARKSIRSVLVLGWLGRHGVMLQRYRLQIYDQRSSEVSNQIFPLQTSTYYTDTISLSGDRVAYQRSFEVLEAILLENSLEHVYQNIWASEGIYDNNRRMVFYMQVVQCNDDLEFLETGWDIYTLVYL